MNRGGAWPWLLAGITTCTLGGVSLVAAVPADPEPVRLLSPAAAGPSWDAASRHDPGQAEASPPASAASAAPAASGPSVWQGSEADGAWTLTADGALQPSLALRRRLDWCLQARGQLPEEQLLPQCLARSGATLPEPAQQQLAWLWRQYLRLLASPTRYLIHPTQPATWQLALVERQQLRRSLLGEPMAEAFYREEEAQLEAMIRDPSLLKETSALPDPAQLAPEARQRLLAELAEQQRFQATLTQAKAAWRTLLADEALSGAQRLQRMEDWLAKEAPEGDRGRLRALLKLPLPGAAG